MSDPVSLFAEREKRTPHTTGLARCLACKHEWTAVVPTGTLDLECPGCGCERGQFKHSFVPAEGKIYVCNFCRGDHFIIKPDSAFCIGCGTYHYPWAENVKP